jgi:probable rRNA maturation factor
MPLAPHVEVIVEDERWGDPSDLIEGAVAATLAHLGLDPAVYEVSVLAADDARIRALNAQFRGKDEATNVLSWPAVDLRADEPGAAPLPPEPGTPDDPEGLGDIALARETCAREALDAGKPLAHHLTHLTVHAVLHLLGYDHETEADAHLMERIEVTILADLAIPDPYAVAAATSPLGSRSA